MGTQENTSTDTTPLVALSHRVHEVAARLAGTESTLRIFSDAEGCDGPLGDALVLLAESCERMNHELCTVADQMTKGGPA